jgi:hypothetical protein
MLSALLLIRAGIGGLAVQRQQYLYAQNATATSISSRSRVATAGKAYAYIVCQNRTYGLFKYSNNTTSSVLPVSSIDNSAIHMGLNQRNTIAVVAQGKTITLFVNGGQIASIQDNAYSQGYIGLVGSAVNTSTEVSYSNVKIWTL